MRKICIYVTCLVALLFMSYSEKQRNERPSGPPAPLPELVIRGDKFYNSQTNEEFKFWGVNFISSKQYELMEDQWHRPEVLSLMGRDYNYMSKTLGVNVVRLCLQLHQYMNGPDEINRENIARLKKVVDIATKNKIYILLCGLNGFRQSAQPEWYENTTDEERWNIHANFWTAIAGAFADNHTVFSYDLMNEPVVNSGNEKISHWGNGSGDPDVADQFVQNITRSPHPDWEPVMRSWIEKMTAAIRAVDADKPISIGYLHLPVYGKFTADLDYASPHFYVTDKESGLREIEEWTTEKPMLVTETWPFWTTGLGAFELRDFILNNKGKTSGWLGHFFGKTIEEYNGAPGGLDDVNTQQWIKAFGNMADEMKSPWP